MTALDRGSQKAVTGPRGRSRLRVATTTISTLHPFQSAASRALKAIAGLDGSALLTRYLESQWWSAERLQEYQYRKLLHLLPYAYQHVAGYRRAWDEAGAHPGDIRTLDDFRRLPILTKDAVREGGRQMLSDSPPFAARRAQTGGSTGAPLVVWRDSNATSRAWALYLRLWTWMGYSAGDPYVNVWGMPVVRQSLPRRQFARLMARTKNEYLVDAFQMDEAKSNAILRRIAEIRPVLLRGYVSAMELLAGTQARERYPVSPKGVTTTAEKLLPQGRTTIEEAFGCAVFDQYGGGECMAIAYECEEHSGLHTCAEHCLLEIVDSRGQPVAPGEVGEVVVTDLDNMAMPFIRYKNGDLARSSSEGCPCGRGLPLIRDVVGRVSDIIQGADGQQVHGEFFTHLLEELDWPERFHVMQFQVAQASDRSIVWKVVCGSEPTPADLAELIRYTKRHVGDLPVDVDLVDEIPTTASGKRRFTMSEVSR